MTCVYTPRTLEDTVAMIERCAITYGGPGWVQLAMIGLATVLMGLLLMVSVFFVLRALR